METTEEPQIELKKMVKCAGEVFEELAESEGFIVMCS